MSEAAKARKALGACGGSMRLAELATPNQLAALVSCIDNDGHVIAGSRDVVQQVVAEILEEQKATDDSVNDFEVADEG